MKPDVWIMADDSDASRTQIATCKTCRHWESDFTTAVFGECCRLQSIAGSVGLVGNWKPGHVVVQEPIAFGARIDAAVTLITPDTFGCVHHEERK